jgi:hypothetical protein
MPFKSDRQRRFLHANEPKVAKKWEENYATGGMIKKAIAKNMGVADLSHMRAGGMISNGSLIPKNKSGPVVESFQDQVCRKSKGS